MVKFKFNWGSVFLSAEASNVEINMGKVDLEQKNKTRGFSKGRSEGESAIIQGWGLPGASAGD